jgi:predicted kinase
VTSIIDWEALVASSPEGQRMRDRAHRDGTIWAHTRQVLEQLRTLEAWQTLPAAALQQRLLGAAWLHDLAWDGAAGHDRRSAVLARGMLWRLGLPFEEREAIVGLIGGHELPYTLLSLPDAARRVHALSYRTCCAHVALLALANALGDAERAVQVGLFSEVCRDAACWSGPATFASDHSRFEYFQRPGRDPSYAAFDDTQCEVLVMSGLPVAGKDTWVQRHGGGWPVISLDTLRAEMDVDPRRAQGAVVQRAREQARSYLREARSFVWNATNLSREVRRHGIDLFAAYRARIRIVYVEAGPARLKRQNEDRARGVPWQAVQRLLSRWEVPTLTEAHSIEYVVTP